MNDESFSPFEERMRAHQVPELAIRAFRHYYSEYRRGESGLLPEKDIRPASDIPDVEALGPEYRNAGMEALSRAGTVKLNGGLGTGMGLEKAKSLLRVKGDLTFLDIIAKQTMALRHRLGATIPLLCMNSFATHDDTVEALKNHSGIGARHFIQNKVPKVLVEGSEPAGDPEDQDSWCPPGHGDIYTALQTSGALQKLIEEGTEFLFVSNSDNLGAVMDPGILGYMVIERLPFLMEVADRTEADKKGGHLARKKDSNALVLREAAQCAPEDADEFQRIDKHRYFNTNNIWLHVPSLVQALKDNEGILPLSLIRNKKSLNPRDPSSPPVYQLETAMGSAISVFPNAGAIRVPRSRFAPVKTCSDLLVLWSDAYVLENDFRVTLHPECRGSVPIVSLDPQFFKFVDQLKEAFPGPAPSLKQCQSLEVIGNVKIPGPASFTGKVVIREQ